MLASYDSLILAFDTEVDLEAYGFWRRLTSQDANLFDWVSYRTLIKHSSTRIFLTYYPYDGHTNEPKLRVEIGSIGKLAYGNNFQQDYDFDFMASKINEQIRSIPGLEHLNAHEATLDRVDPCINYQVGEYVPDFIEMISRLHYPRRATAKFTNYSCLPKSIDKKTRNDNANGVMFWNNTVSSVFYHKLKECQNQAAYGILRHETRICTPTLITNRLGLTVPKLEYLTHENLAIPLLRDLEELSLTDDIFFERTAEQQLIDKFDIHVGRRYYSYLLEFQKYPTKSPKDIAIELGVHPKTIYAHRRALKAANISTALPPIAAKLPGLAEQINSDIHKKVIKVLSDTGEFVDPYTETELETLKTKLQAYTNKVNSSTPIFTSRNFDSEWYNISNHSQTSVLELNEPPLTFAQSWWYSSDPFERHNNSDISFAIGPHEVEFQLLCQFGTYYESIKLTPKGLCFVPKKPIKIDHPLREFIPGRLNIEGFQMAELEVCAAE